MADETIAAAMPAAMPEKPLGFFAGVSRFWVGAFSTSDNKTGDIGRIMWFIGHIAGWVVGTLHNWSAGEMTAFHTTWAGTSASALLIKRTTEPTP